MMKVKYEIYNVLLAFFAILELITTTNTIMAYAHREHKVHNIVLYPDKHSWCKTLAIKQVISYPGCKSEEIDNNVCVGTCFSYSIPHTEPSDPGEVIVPYCDSCQPSDTTWHHVTLECTKNSIDTPPQLVKRVQIINNCSCTSCEKSLLSQIHSTNQFNDEDDNDLIMSHVHHDVPDVLKILNRNNETSSSSSGMTSINNSFNSGSSDGDGDGDGNNNDDGHNSNTNNDDDGHNSNTSNIENKFKDIKQILNHKIITLLKNIQENNSVHDKEQLMDLLRMIQGPNSKLNDKNIEEFVNSLHSENIELDIPRLREILIKFEHSKYYEKHRKYFEKIQQQHHQNHGGNIVDNENDMNSLHHIHHIHRHHSYEGSSSMEEGDNNHQQNGNHGISNENIHHSSDTNSQNPGDEQQQHHHQLHSSSSTSAHHSHHHHHHIGENIIGHGHLTRGPHGALVIEPEHSNHHIGSDDIIDDEDDHVQHHPHHNNDQIQHEKLDVNPHELKPNHAGTLLSYSGHPVESSRNS